MTEQPKTRRSLAEDLEERDPIEMAAAGAAVDAVALLHDAMQCAGVRQNELAARVGVSEGRVSQVVNGDGNLRVSTLARYLRAAGYRLRLTAQPAEAGTPPIRTPRRGTQRREVFVSSRVVTCLSDDGVHQEHVLEISAAHPRTFATGTYEWVTNVATGETDRGPSAPVREGAPNAAAPREERTHA